MDDENQIGCLRGFLWAIAIEAMVAGAIMLAVVAS